MRITALIARQRLPILGLAFALVPVAAFVAPLAAQPPNLEAAKFVPNNAALEDRVGIAIAADGDTLVVGASEGYPPGAAAGGVTGPGYVAVFQRTGSEWSSSVEIAILTASDGQDGDRFGDAVAIHDDMIVVGAWQEGSAGAAYVFMRPATGWQSATETVKLVATNPPVPGILEFGTSVAVSPEIVAVGAARDGTYGGAVYVFERDATGAVNTTESARLASSFGSGERIHLGRQVAVQGDTVVAAASAVLSAPGGVYVFEKPSTGWADATETVRLVGSGGFDRAESVALDGDTLVFGANDDVFVFERPPTGWVDATEVAVLSAPRESFFNTFGRWLSCEGDTVVVGLRFGRARRYEAWIFEKPSTGWQSTDRGTRLVARETSVADEFGISIAVDDGVVFVGAPTSGVGGAFAFVAPTEFPGSGCGAPAMALSGSTRIGNWLRVSPPCAEGATFWGLFLGVPPTRPTPVLRAVCGDGLCRLACRPMLLLPASAREVGIQNDPALIGSTLCMQGACAVPDGCLTITDRVDVVVTR